MKTTINQFISIRGFLCSVMAILFVAWVVACGDGDDDEEETATNTTTTGATPTPTPTETLVQVVLTEDTGVANDDKITTNPHVDIVAPSNSEVTLTAETRLNDEDPIDDAAAVERIGTDGVFTSADNGTNEDLEIDIGPPAGDSDVLTVVVKAVADDNGTMHTNSLEFKLVKGSVELDDLELNTDASGTPMTTPDNRVVHTYTEIENADAKLLFTTNDWTDTNKLDLSESPIRLFTDVVQEEAIDVKAKIKVTYLGHETLGNELSFAYLKPNPLSVSLFTNTGVTNDDAWTSNANINIDAPAGATVTVTAMTNLGTEAATEHAITSLDGGGNTIAMGTDTRKTNLDIGLAAPTDETNVLSVMVRVVATDPAGAVAGDDAPTYTNTLETFKLVKGSVTIPLNFPIANTRQYVSFFYTSIWWANLNDLTRLHLVVTVDGADPETQDVTPTQIATFTSHVHDTVSGRTLASGVRVEIGVTAYVTVHGHETTGTTLTFNYTPP